MNEKQIHFQQYDGRLEEKRLSQSTAASSKGMEKTEEEIWKAFRKGDEEALVYIYQEYVNKMYNYGCQFCANHELVSDSIQELFTELISKRHKLGNTVSIKFYLFKALRRKLLRAFKRENAYHKREHVFAQEGFNVLEDTSLKFINQEFNEQQKSIISNECNQLAPKQKEALLLYFYEGMSYQEIAKTIGMSRTKSARALIYRAIDALSQRLQHYKDILYPLWPLLYASQLL